MLMQRTRLSFMILLLWPFENTNSFLFSKEIDLGKTLKPFIVFVALFRSFQKGNTTLNVTKKNKVLVREWSSIATGDKLGLYTSNVLSRKF